MRLKAIEQGATPSHQLFGCFNAFFSPTWKKTRVEQVSRKVFHLWCILGHPRAPPPLAPPVPTYGPDHMCLVFCCVPLSLSYGPERKGHLFKDIAIAILTNMIYRE